MSLHKKQSTNHWDSTSSREISQLFTFV